MTMFEPPLTGGCQCGAVRYRVTETAARASICHCRMCQKAFGSYFGPFAAAAPGAFRFTRGQPRWWRSSNIAQRGFCGTCGTPLFVRTDGEEIEFALGGLDDPARVPPVVQVGVGARLAFVTRLSELPEEASGPGTAEAETYARIVSHQHPDHDTPEWPNRRPA